VTASVVAAIAPGLEQAEIERAKRKPTESLDAYDYYHRGMAGVHHRWTQGATTGVEDVLPGDRTRSGFRIRLWNGGAMLLSAEDRRLDD
jgi:hypothetical protein